MTEPSVPTPVPPAAQVAPPEQTIDGMVVAPATFGEDSTVAAGLEVAVRSQWDYARRRFVRHRLAMIGFVGLVIIFGAGIFANWVAPYLPTEIDLNNILHAPTVTGHHFFGTDDTGRDYMSRVIYGIRTSLEVGVTVAVVSSIVGLIIGAVAGYYGGLIDNLLMRLTDLVLTLPALAVLLTAAALLGQGSQWRLTFILAGFFWTGIARVVRGVFLSLREKEYVEAAKASGAGDARIMFRHILPNTLGPIVVNATISVAAAIITEAALSFLGFGVNPLTTPSLGGLLSQAQANPQQWWLTIFPGLTIVLITLCVNFLGDGLRDALDPSQRRVRA